tara:strand:- start:550 stop:756 length:207 start_codon:yes stop_codon:yes gene_type:complete
MSKFYEVRRQLQNRSRWIKEAFFEKKKDAQTYIDFKLNHYEDKKPKELELVFEIIEHKFHSPPKQKDD